MDDDQEYYTYLYEEHEPEQLDLFGRHTVDSIEEINNTKGPVIVTLPPRIALPECPIAAEVMQRLKDRADAGMETYGTTMERTDIDTVGWIDHTIEELLDAANYLTRLKKDLAND